MKTLLAGLLVLGALLIGSATAGVHASVGFRPSGIVPHSGKAPTVRAAHAATANGFTCGSITCSAYEAGIDGYFEDVAAASGAMDNVYSVATQYNDDNGLITYNEEFGGAYVDTHPFPADGCPTSAASACLTEAQLLAEINSDLSLNGWTANDTNIFFILLPAEVDTCVDGNAADGCASNAFCAYHDASSSLIYAVEPFGAAWNCNGSSRGQGFPNGPEIDQTVNTISHEHIEAITDPYLNAWFGKWGDEIGDLCAWGFGSPLGTTPGGEPYNQVINGHDYSLQLEYSNGANPGGGCVSSLYGPWNNVTRGVPPLLVHGGPVMHTNTVHTIYWIPDATPAITIAPAVSGSAAVGEELSTTDGTWTNSPTSYEYKWQRCDTAGLHCIDIENATSWQYTPVAADGGYELRALVRASNDTGPAASYARSAATSIVPPVEVPALVGSPAISLVGVMGLGNLLFTSDGTWTNLPTSYAYQWQRCSTVGTNCVNIANNATSSQYKLAVADVGHEIRSEVRAINAVGPASDYAPSAVTTVVARPPRINTVNPPKLTGIKVVGNSLHVKKGTWKYSPTSFEFVWLRCNTSGGNCVVIDGATSTSYLLTSADVGHKLKVDVIASNSAGSGHAYTNLSTKITS